TSTGPRDAGPVRLTAGPEGTGPGAVRRVPFGEAVGASRGRRERFGGDGQGPHPGPGGVAPAGRAPRRVAGGHGRGGVARRGGANSPRCTLRKPSPTSPSNGGRPVSRQYRVAPSE